MLGQLIRAQRLCSTLATFKEAVVMIAKSALKRGYAKRMLNGVFGRFLAKWWRARELRRGELRQWFRKAAAWALKDVVRERKQKQMERRGIENIKEGVSDVNHEQRG